MVITAADQLQAFLEGHRSPLGNRLASADDSDRYWVWLFRVVYPVAWLYQDKVWIYLAYERRADISKAMDPDSRRHWGNEMLRATDPALLIMVVPKVRETFDESSRGTPYLQAVCQEAATSCALERCRLAQGQYPTSLDALVPTWLKQVPGDLLATNAAPMKYRREADGGFVLYSIGLNGVDDQGRPGSLDKDWRGVQSDSPRLDDGDWVWRQPGLYDALRANGRIFHSTTNP